MTWLQTIRAAWRRRIERLIEADRLSMWWTEPHLPGVEDTGSIVATAEDLAEIGPADPVFVPGHGRGRHRAIPDEPVRRPT